jgi:hypothetical protein
MRQYGHIDLGDLMSERRYSPGTSYRQSKFAMPIFGAAPAFGRGRIRAPREPI